MTRRTITAIAGAVVVAVIGLGFAGCGNAPTSALTPAQRVCSGQGVTCSGPGFVCSDGASCNGAPPTPITSGPNAVKP